MKVVSIGGGFAGYFFHVIEENGVWDAIKFREEIVSVMSLKITKGRHKSILFESSVTDNNFDGAVSSWFRSASIALSKGDVSDNGSNEESSSCGDVVKVLSDR
jgi:hypothetical protein